MHLSSRSEATFKNIYVPLVRGLEAFMPTVLLNRLRPKTLSVLVVCSCTVFLRIMANFDTPNALTCSGLFWCFHIPPHSIHMHYTIFNMCM